MQFCQKNQHWFVSPLVKFSHDIFKLGSALNHIRAAVLIKPDSVTIIDDLTLLTGFTDYQLFMKT